MTDIRDLRNLPEKKLNTGNGGIITFDDFSATGVGTIHSTTVFEIPENSLITEAYLEVVTAGTAAVTLDLKIGAIIAIDDRAVTVGISSNGNTLPINSGTGKSVTIDSTAALTAGKFIVIVKYFEYLTKTGYLTKYTS